MAPNSLDPETKKAESEDQKVRTRIVQKESETESHSSEADQPQQSHQDKPAFKPKFRWPDLLAQLFIHVGSLYGLYYLITLKAKLYTYIWCKHSPTSKTFLGENQFFHISFSVVVLVYASGIGITAGQILVHQYPFDRS